MEHKKTILFDKPKKKRKNEKVLELSDDDKNYESQITLLKTLFEIQKENKEEKEKEKEYNKETNIHNSVLLAKREINKKIASYKKQDIDKNRYYEPLFITFEETVEMLHECQLLCYYCRQKMNIFYDNVREKSQWTLDRIDNDVCHSKDNLVISCLSCNLQKRRRESEAFKFMKQMKIEKREN